MKIIQILSILFLNIIFTSQVKPSNSVFKQVHQDYVPNSATAVKIAEAVWYPIYGSKIYDDTPFVAVLKDSEIWVVNGTLKRYMSGGTPYLEIQKYDGKILMLAHGK